MNNKRPTNWTKRFEYYLSSPDREKQLNQHLKKVITDNPGAMREQTFKLLEQSLIGNQND